MAEIRSISLVVGMEVHVELATRSKMFTRAPSPAHPDNEGADPNTLIDPMVLALRGRADLRGASRYVAKNPIELPSGSVA
ncbi:MAG: hypothetical protein AAFX05_12385 [Planctomycetota bacterium]